MRYNLLYNELMHPSKPSTDSKEIKPENPDIEVKIVFIGETDTGKTSFVHYYTKKSVLRFPQKSEGASFSTSTMTSRKKTVNLIMWDTSGQDKYESFIPLYLKGADGIIVNYDITKRDSYNKALSKYTNLKNEHPNAVIMVSGNKADLEGKRQVPTSDGMILRNKLFGFEFFESNKSYF